MMRAILLSLLYLCATAYSDDCIPCSEDECRAVAEASGLELGGGGFEFAGDYSVKGCYAYSSGELSGMAFFGLGGSIADMLIPVSSPQYRPVKEECSEETLRCNALTKTPQGCKGGCAWNRRLRSCEPFSRSTQRMMFASDFQTGGNLDNNDPDSECYYRGKNGRGMYVFQTKSFCDGPQRKRVKDRLSEYGRRLSEMATFTLGEFKCADENQLCTCEGLVLYGADSRWSEPNETFGSVQCSNTVFGDPAPGTKKSCVCFESQSVQSADGIFMNGDMTVWGHKKEYTINYEYIMQEAAKFGMSYFPGLGNHDFGGMVESAAAFGADPDSGTEPVGGRRNLAIRFNNKFEAFWLNENVNNERSYLYMKRFIETYCTGGHMYTGASHGVNIHFAANQCDDDKYMYSFDMKSLGYSIFNKGVVYFQLQRNPSARDFEMREHDGFKEYTRFTVEGPGRWFLDQLKQIESDDSVHAIVLNWHYPSCIRVHGDTDEMCDLPFLDRIYRAIERHNRDFPSKPVLAVFTGHWHGLVGDHSGERHYPEGPQNSFFRRAGVPIFQTGSSYAGSALDIDIDLESKSFTVNAWGRRELNAPLQRHCTSKNFMSRECTFYNFDGTTRTVIGGAAEAPYMTNPGAFWSVHQTNDDVSNDQPPAVCGDSFTEHTGLDCWDQVTNGAIVPRAHCEGPMCTKADTQRCCKSAPVTCLKKNECCAAGTQCHGCPGGSSEAVWPHTCWSFARCNKSGGCSKRPGQCCVWGSDCYGCPWGTEHAWTSECGSSRKCKSAP